MLCLDVPENFIGGFLLINSILENYCLRSRGLSSTNLALLDFSEVMFVGTCVELGEVRVSRVLEGTDWEGTKRPSQGIVLLDCLSNSLTSTLKGGS